MNQVFMPYKTQQWRCIFQVLRGVCVYIRGEGYKINSQLLESQIQNAGGGAGR